MDKTHRYARSKPEGRANVHKARDGSEIWISRPEDAGETVEKKQAAPFTYQGDRVPSTRRVTRAAAQPMCVQKEFGQTVVGRWRLERRLDTGNPDDTAFDLARSYKMALATFHRTGERDKASGLIELKFASRR